jgi:hypothetical protein
VTQHRSGAGRPAPPAVVATLITSAPRPAAAAVAPPSPSGRKRKLPEGMWFLVLLCGGVSGPADSGPAEVADALAAARPASPSVDGAPGRTRTGSAGLGMVPIMIPAAALARRASSDWHHPTGPVAVTLPTAVLTRRASVDRGNTPIDALFSPNYHTPATETASDDVPASTSWSGTDRVPLSRRASVVSSLEHSFSVADHAPHVAAAAAAAAAESSPSSPAADALAAINLSGSSMDEDRDGAATTAQREEEGEELVAAGTVILEMPMLRTAAAALPVISGAEGDAHATGLSSMLLQSTPVSALVAAAHKAAEAAIDAEFDPYAGGHRRSE